MADVRAFRGYRYNLGVAGALSDLVAPPYDVIDRELQQKLYDRSPNNAIRIELTQEKESQDKYSVAAQTLNSWLNDGVIQQDTLRTLYVVEQEFTVEGKTYHRRGFIARVRLEPFGQGKIYAHEETMSGPKEDRLKLMRATGMNLSPIFGLYPDPQNEVFSRLEKALRSELPLVAIDHLGVISRLWLVTDDKIAGSVISAMTDKPIFIADGHHRYETGVRYRDEQTEAGLVNHPDAPQNFIMMMLVSMSDPGLIILPTHRLVSGFTGLTSSRLKEILASYFSLSEVASAQDAWDWVQIHGGQNAFGFYTKADGKWTVGTFTRPEFMAQLAANHSEDWQQLGVSILHEAVLKKLLPEATGQTSTCRYVHLLSEVEEDIQAQGSDLAVLVPPAEMGHVEQIAGNLEKMPAKSTYFYPKLLTGLVFNSVKVN